jgi:hypothetical protein
VRRTLIVCSLVLASLVAALPAAAQGLLPPVFGDWAIGQTANNQTATLEQSAGVDAPILQEYGYESIEHRDYFRAGQTVGVTLFRMVDPSSAYGAFTYLRPAGMPASNLTHFSAASQERALIVVGNFVLDIRGAKLNQPATSLDALVSSLAPKSDRRPYPDISEHLPSEGLVPGTERYVLGPLALQKLLPVVGGDWLGFSESAEAVMGRYRKGGQEVTLLVAVYPTQQLAADRLEKVSSIVGTPDGATPTPDHPAVLIDRKAGVISFVFAHSPGTYAKTVLGQVVYGHNVTWNAPSFKATEPSLNVMIIGAFIGTGAIVLIAIVSGLGFAVLRLIVKAFFPGKVFDRPRNMEIIQLDLNGRSINTKDFY